MTQRFATPRQMEIGLGILRIVTGIVFAVHGYQKVFIMGLDGTTGFFTQVEFHFQVSPQSLSAPLSSGAESRWLWASLPG